MSRLMKCGECNEFGESAVNGFRITPWLAKSLKRLLRDEQGSSGLEYVLITVLSAIGSVMASAYLQRGFDEVFCRTAQVLSRRDIVIMGWLCD